MEIKKEEYYRMKSESLEEYNYRICRNKALKIFKLKWNQVRDLLNGENNVVYGSSKWRKDYQVIQKYLDGRGDKIKIDEDILKEIKLARIELKNQEKESYIALTQLRDEKNEERAWWREDARAKAIIRRLDESIDRLIKNKARIIPEVIQLNPNSENSAMVLFGDTHYGAYFKIEGLKNDILAEYNPTIFEERMWQLRDEILEFSEKENIKKFHIVDAGDSIEGLLHLSQLKALRGNIVDDIMDYSDFIDDWLSELSKKIIIEFYTSEGNHADLRLLSGKKGSFPHENLEKIYSRTIVKAMKTNPNVNVNINVRGLNYFNVEGYDFLTAHGQAEKNILNSISEYSSLYHINIDYFVSGHMHSKLESDTNGGAEIIRIRSIMGANEYSIFDLKKGSPAGATIFSVRKGTGRKYINEVKFDNL